MKIQELKIFTPNLLKQKRFYSSVLGLEIKKQSERNVSFIIGNSILTLEYRLEFTPYHFAINIPANKENEALNWLKKRVTILLDGVKEIQYFDFWNANAIYFYDKDKNIVELIARKNLQNDSDQEFDQKSFLEISEIGIPTVDINREFEILNTNTGIEIHSGNLERFCAIGSDNGLFIVINKTHKKKWYPTEDKPLSSDFGIRFIERGNEYAFEYENEVLSSKVS